MEVVRTFSRLQQSIIESPTRGITAVIAYAGCGKSTTLVGYAAARKTMRISYICFNRSVAVEARATFKSAGVNNVEAMTMHSMAYHEYGHSLKDKLELPPEPGALEPFLGVAGIPAIRKKAVAVFALATIANYCNTADRSITSDHIPFERICDSGLDPSMILRASRNLFKAMLNSPGCPATHDVYMKIFQLSEPDLSEQFDLIMVDEGQDLNPVVVDILVKQRIPVIIVGDPHQSIYGFRGAVNALEADFITQTLYLNESYRFARGHAELATYLLREYKGVIKPLIGLGKAASVIKPGYETSTINKHAAGGLEIYRTNGALFQRAVELAVGDKEKGTGIVIPPQVSNIRYVGGFDSYKFEDLIAAYKLFKDDQGFGAFKQYDSWSDFKTLGELTEDPNITSTVNTVERFGGAIPVFVNKLKQSATNSINAEVTLTNAHKSKGLEADTVKVGGDYPSLHSEKATAEEINLQYVAITRAKRVLGLPDNMMKELGMEVGQKPNAV